MSNVKIINGITYDFDRCTKEQLAAYVADFLERGTPRFRVTGRSVHTSGNVVLAAARVERKEDVARDLAQYACAAAANPDADHPFNATRLYQFVDRYNKAVG